MSGEREEIDFAHCHELFRQVECVLTDLAKDAEVHGFDVSPYLLRLAELNVLDLRSRASRLRLKAN